MNLDLGIAKLSVFILIPIFALLFEGIRRKVFARMQHRIGPPIHQPFLDIIKLFHKGKSDALGQENLFFRISPYLDFIVCWILFIPILGILVFEYDFILLIYLLVLSGGLSILAGLSSNNPFSIISSIRDMILMICYEIIFAIILIIIMIFTNLTTLSQLNTIFLAYKLPLALIGFLYIMTAIIRITPFDTVSAHTEVLEGEETEFSGKGLAYLLWSAYVKDLFMAYLLLFLFIGYFPWYYLFMLSFVIAIIIAFIRATTCRYKVTQTFHRLVYVLVIVIVEFVRIRLGFVW
tara:strand:- start:1944 stop:2819 length:876 start_codon:yes stop_codon:yes gene_type:complete